MPTSVFINCPLDEHYWDLLRPLAFTVAFLGYSPRLSPQTSDSATVRLEKIVGLIESSPLGIHDLSRLKSESTEDFCRMNMPFELGIDIGAQRFGTKQLSSKRILVLEANRYDYQKALSDLSGCDIKAHKNQPMELTRVVRNWFVETESLHEVYGPTEIWNRYNDFMLDLHDLCMSRGFSEDDFNSISIAEYTRYLVEWVNDQNDFPGGISSSR